MKTSLVVEISRRATRALDLGKGMFFDSEAMCVLAECGALDAIQSAASQHLKERASERLEARTSQRSAARRDHTRPATGKSFQPRRPAQLRLVEAEESAPGEDAFRRARRMLEKPKRK
jgi:hypothetical protein